MTIEIDGDRLPLSPPESWSCRSTAWMRRESRRGVRKDVDLAARTETTSVKAHGIRLNPRIAAEPGALSVAYRRARDRARRERFGVLRPDRAGLPKEPIALSGLC